MGATSESGSTTSGSDASDALPSADQVASSADDAAAVAQSGEASDVPTSGEEAAGDAVSGMTNDSDGTPAPSGSIPPGPGTPDEADTRETALPPLSERMY